MSCRWKNEFFIGDIIWITCVDNTFKVVGKFYESPGVPIRPLIGSHEPFDGKYYCNELCYTICSLKDNSLKVFHHSGVSRKTNIHQFHLFYDEWEDISDTIEF